MVAIVLVLLVGVLTLLVLSRGESLRSTLRMTEEQQRLWEEADRLYDQGLFDEAIEKFQIIIHENPNLADIHYELGCALRDTGNLDRAIESFQLAVKLDNRHFKGFTNLGALYSNKNDSKAAVRAYMRSLAIEPRQPVTVCALGHIHAFELGKVKEGIAQLIEASQLDPDYPDPYFHLAYAYDSENEPEKVTEALEKFIDMPKQNSQLPKEASEIARQWLARMKENLRGS